MAQWQRGACCVPCSVAPPAAVAAESRSSRCMPPPPSAPRRASEPQRGCDKAAERGSAAARGEVSGKRDRDEAAADREVRCSNTVDGSDAAAVFTWLGERVSRASVFLMAKCTIVTSPSPPTERGGGIACVSVFLRRPAHMYFFRASQDNRNGTGWILKWLWQAEGD